VIFQELSLCCVSRTSAFGGGLKGSIQHPLRASNENANSMLDLYLFKGRNSPVTFSRTNQDSMAVVPNRRKTLGFKALAIAKGSVALTG
jgi:hypothetical protein